MFKKCLFFTVLVMSFSVSVSAADVTWGGFVGINSGWASGEDWSDMVDYYEWYYGQASNKSKIGFTVATYLDIAFTRSFSLQPELQYTFLRDGIKITDYYDDSVEITETYNTLVFPLLAKYKIRVGVKKGLIDLFAGPAMILILGDVKYKEEYDLSGNTSAYESDYEPDSRVGMGIIIGAGYEVPTQKGAFIFDIRYSKSLTDFYDNYDQKLNTLGLNMGYGFKL